MEWIFGTVAGTLARTMTKEKQPANDVIGLGGWRNLSLSLVPDMLTSLSMQVTYGVNCMIGSQ